MGNKSLPIPMTLFRENRIKVATALKNVPRVNDKAVVFLAGGDNISLYDTDVDFVFRQVSSFFLLLNFNLHLKIIMLSDCFLLSFY